LIGTAAGVLFYEFAMQMPLNSTVLTAWVMLCAFIIPYTLKRNYFYASFFVTTFVVALLEIAIVSQGTAQPDATMAFLRLKATLAGCILSILGTVVSKALASIHEPQSKQN
ncbi:MAG: FUSC family protein, partial [Bdellovibrionales bacterium]